MTNTVHAVSLTVPSIEVVIPEEILHRPEKKQLSTENAQSPSSNEDPFFKIPEYSRQDWPPTKQTEVEKNFEDDDLFLTLYFAKGRLGFGTTDPSQILIREIAKDSSNNLAKFTLKVPPSGLVQFPSVDFSIRPINKKDPQVQRFGLSTNAFNLLVLVLHHGPIFTWKNTIAGRQSVYSSIPTFEIDRGFYHWTKVQIIPFSVLMTMIEKLQNLQMNNLQSNLPLKIQIQEDLLYQSPD